MRRIAITLGAALVLAAALAVGPVGAADPVPATFTVQGSVEQFAVTHAVPGASIALHAPGGAVVATGTVDAQGSSLFRDVPAGPGYVAVQDDHGALSASAPTTVLDPDTTPPPSFYAGQRLTEGFGYLTMRDGTKLAATVRLPGPPDRGPYPTVVEYSGYSPANPSSPQPSTLIAQTLGYATVGVNMRGTGCSGGSFMYFEELQSLDGYDVIEIVGSQPWVAHGKVGMVGVSYPGISQLFVAAEQPPHLAAIAPLSVIADTYRSTLYPGGIFNDGFALDWATGRVNDAKPYGQGWERDIVRAGGPNGERCAENQLLRLQNPDLVQLIDDNPFYTDEGDALSPVTFVDRIDVPIFSAGAWQDEQTGGHFPVMWDELTVPSRHRKLMATNGTHVDSLLAQTNRWFEFLEFYVARRIPKLSPIVRLGAPAFIEQFTGIPGVTIEADRFTQYPSYAAALAAYEAEAPVRVIFENGSGVPGNPGAPYGTFERGFSQWPPAEAQPTTWWFQPDQRLTTTPPTVRDGDGRATTAYVYDPAAKPETSYPGSGDGIWGPRPRYSWQPLPLGKALAFDSAPLTSEIVMAGSGSVDLHLRSSMPDTDLEVTLSELRPDGTEMYVQNGWLRASHRALDAAKSTVLAPWHTHRAEDAAPLPAGAFTPVRVEIFPFAHVFRPGSRLRISVEAPGGNRPRWTFDTLPATGRARNEIAHSSGRPSKVVLPVISDVDAPDSLPPCPSRRGQPCRTAYGNSTPTSVRAVAHGRTVTIGWRAPSTIRDGLVLRGYDVRDRRGALVASVGPTATSTRLLHVGNGRHHYTVEARYDTGTTSGVSTPSNTVGVPVPFTGPLPPGLRP